MTDIHDDTRPLRVGMISLGCAKNLVDSEIMLGHLMAEGTEITSDAEEADVLIVNTCSFIDAAQEESVDTILESAEFRKAHHRGQGLVVAGCLTQRFRNELPKLLPEVDVFMGIDEVAKVGQLVRQAHAHRQARLPVASAPEVDPVTEAPVADEDLGSVPILEVTSRPAYIPDHQTPRFRLTPDHFAYLKIAEGCNHPCSFCIIPRMRGSHRSRAMDDILQEAQQLIHDGVKEINLISQDSTYYGLDLRPDAKRTIASPERFQSAAASLSKDAASLPSLLRSLNALEGDFWIRILYTHPAHWTDELIETIAACPKIARYVDIPLQHIHPVMLERMRRETSREYIEALLQRIRSGVPEIALRTTFIVGFPGETEACFDALLDFIRTTRFERLGLFSYSHEDGTRAAGMSAQIDEERKAARRDQAMALQLEIARELNAAQVGRRLRVLVEGEAKEDDPNIRSWEHGLIRQHTQSPGSESATPYFIARSQADAPDIDGRVYIQGPVQSGSFVDVTVTGYGDYDLIATPLAP